MADEIENQTQEGSFENPLDSVSTEQNSVFSGDPRFDANNENILQSKIAIPLYDVDPTTLPAPRIDGYRVMYNGKLYIYSNGAWVILAQPTFETFYFDDTNDATERTVVSFTVPGNALGTTGGILVHGPVPILNNTLGYAIAINVKLGSTTILTASVQPMGVGSSSNFPGHISIMFKNDNSATAQRASMTGFFFDDSVGTSEVNRRMYDAGTATEDTTNDLVFAVTAQWNGASPSNGFLWTGMAITTF